MCCGLRISGKHLTVGVCFITICIFSVVTLSILNLFELGDIVSALWIGGISLYIIVSTANMNASKNARIFVYLGFLIRLAVAVIVEFKIGSIGEALSFADQATFWNTANSYYMGDYTFRATNYPFLIKNMFYVIGISEMAVVMTNILIWYLGFYVLLKAGGIIRGKKKLAFWALYAFLPWQTIINAGIYRETIICFSLMLSYYFLWRWMNEKKGIKYMLYSAFAAVPAFWLHAGNIAMYGVMLIVYSMWSQKSGKWNKIGLRTSLLIAAIILILPIYNYVLSPLFEGYFPSSFSLEAFFNRPFVVSGRTDYMPSGVYVSNISGFLFWGIYRMIYYWISPSPRFWSSVIDPAFFVLDVLPMLACIFWLSRYARKSFDKRIYAVLIAFALFTFIFAWGTANAFTAMRHRDTLVGMFAVAGLLALNNDKTDSYVSKMQTTR